MTQSLKNSFKNVLWTETVVIGDSVIDRLGFHYAGHLIQVNRQDGDDSQITVSIDGKMVSRTFTLDEAKRFIERSV